MSQRNPQDETKQHPKVPDSSPEEVARRILKHVREWER